MIKSNFLILQCKTHNGMFLLSAKHSPQHSLWQKKNNWDWDKIINWGWFEGTNFYVAQIKIMHSWNIRLTIYDATWYEFTALDLLIPLLMFAVLYICILIQFQYKYSMYVINDESISDTAEKKHIALLIFIIVINFSCSYAKILLLPPPFLDSTLTFICTRGCTVMEPKW